MTKAGGRGMKHDIEQLYYKDNITDVDDIATRLHKKYRLKRQPCKQKVVQTLRQSKRLKTNEEAVPPNSSSTVTCLEEEEEEEEDKSTNVNVELDDKKNDFIGGPRFKDLGGMNQVVELLKKKVLFPLFHPKLTQRLGVSPISGILLHGPPGCGKTTLAHAIANEIGVPFYKIVATELVSGVSGASEENIRELFSKAYRTAPSIVFIDEIDAVASKRENLQREMERRIVTQLMACMDESNKMVPQHEKDARSKDSVCRPGYVLVIGATNRPDAVDAALRRPGRFDREIVLGVPDETARVEILSVLTSKLEVEGDFDLLKLARRTPGFVGADLAALANEAGNLAMERIIDQRKSELSIECLNEENTEEWWRHPWSPEEEEKLYITMGDFEEAAKMVQPSSKREGFNSIPIVNWEDVGGLDSLTKEFEQHIIRRIKHPEDYEEFGVHLETGFLLYGPPGCGKTLIAKAVANEAGANFIHIKGPEILNKYVGESELAVRRIFSRARTCSPCILFFDEVDALTTKRGKEGGWVVERVLNQLLIELDGAEQRRGVYVIGATNRPEVIDRALLRPGRLGELIYVPLPSPDERGLILKALSKKKPIDTTVDLVSFGKNNCKNLSGADLAALMNKAAMAALKDKWQEVQNSDATQCTIKEIHFDQALKKVRPSVSGEQIKNYMRFQKSFMGVYGAMAQQPVQGVSATDANEIERLSAKESLLLSFKDAGGFDALVAGTTTDFQRIDVNERITSLERLNPTARPTTSPFLEGRWNFEWLGTGTPGLFASKIAFERFPSSLAKLSKMDVLIKDGNAKITAQLKLLNSIECKFILSTKLSVEGPLRMKEEYLLESLTIDEFAIPQQLRGTFGQAATTMPQLPVPIRDALTNGLKVSLSGSYQRLFMISYLDEEILVIRDSAGIPEVLTRLDTQAETM